MATINKRIKELTKFIKTDVWKIRLKEQSKNRSFLIKQLRIILLALRGFDEDKCMLRASALTFYSLLSIVPVVAMIFGIAKGFGIESMLEEQFGATDGANQEVMKFVLEFANSMLENTKGGLVAGVGIVVLFWSVMKVLGNIEQSFNDIWEIKRARPLVRKFSDYLSIMLIAPVLVIMSGSATVYISTQIVSITESISIFGFFMPVVGFLVKLIPYSLVWLLLTFIYIVMPNTKVQFGAALFAGIIAGTIFQLTEFLYINFQIGVASYNAIYGSFAALPLFLAWLQISWLIILFGAELSFAKQNVDKYELEIDSSDISYNHKRLLSVLITHHLVLEFDKGEEGSTAQQISDDLSIPIRIVRQILFDLQAVHIISEVHTEDPKVATYQPAKSINKISISTVVNAIENLGGDELPVEASAELKTIKASMDAIQKTIEKSSANILLKDI